jgi:glycosyltransferase involved in cell wall biosynthesis
MVRYDWDILEADHMPYFPLFALKLVNLFKRKPFFATWHEAVGLKAWRGYIGYGAGTVAYALERLAVRMPDHIIAVSDRTRDLLRSELHYKGPLTLVPNGIDYPTIRDAKTAQPKTDIVYAGRLVRHKRVDLLLDAIALVAKSRPEVRVAIVGGGPELERIKSQIARLGLEKNVLMTGRLEHSSDVFSYMKASRVFVSPSTREGFGITILEAYACGLRVVTVRHPDNAAQYLVRDDAGAVCELHAQALADAIESQLNLATKKLKIDGAQFDWSRSVEALTEAYGL